MDFQTPKGETIFCDDIREDSGGKVSLIGVYNTTLVAPAFPIMLPKLGFWIRYFQDCDDAGAPDLTVKIFLTDQGRPGPATYVHTFKFPPPPSSSGDSPREIRRLQVTIPIVENFVRLNQAGRIAVHGETKDHDNIALGRLTVIQSTADTDDAVAIVEST